MDMWSWEKIWFTYILSKILSLHDDVALCSHIGGNRTVSPNGKTKGELSSRELNKSIIVIFKNKETDTRYKL